ncbi:MAG: UDP-N-acetylmuramate dehydrogenase [Acidimicrobiia bacterium]|nr:UDP-N-acetylmuramate dehydrogenase [Acidimicrobiia bacterium]
MTVGGLQTGVDLAALTTYKLGGRADRFLEAVTVQDLLGVTPVEGQVLIVGRGSNLVIADEGFPGLVIRLGSGFGHIELVAGGGVVAGGSAPLPAVARSAARWGRSGLEWMVGVPGSVGGAVRMNAGCFGRDIAASMIEATVVDVRTGTLRSVTPSQLGMAYRHSEIRVDDVVISSRFSTVQGDKTKVEAAMREITRWRRDHQPGGTLNAGSVFKNPPGDAAGRIIDDLGLKGFRVGGVAVSEKHANFMVADPSASARDVWELVHRVRLAVREATGIDLQPEIQFAGFEERP